MQLQIRSGNMPNFPGTPAHNDALNSSSITDKKMTRFPNNDIDNSSVISRSSAFASKHDQKGKE